MYCLVYGGKITTFFLHGKGIRRISFEHVESRLLYVVSVFGIQSLRLPQAIHYPAGDRGDSAYMMRIAVHGIFFAAYVCVFMQECLHLHSDINMRYGRNAKEQRI